MEYTKLRTQKVRFLLVIVTIVFGFVLPSYLGKTIAFPESENANINPPSLQENTVYLNSTPPIIDGNLESYVGEWSNSTKIISEFGSPYRTMTIRVQANDTHLFMGISYISPIFVPINTTIPVGDTYNNESHTWYSIVFDNNDDGTLGTELSPGDSIAINYRAKGAQDSFVNGTYNNSLVLDVNVTGTENSLAVVNGTVKDDFGNHVISIEIAKELNSGDKEGNDIKLYPSESIYFLILAFENKTAVYNYSWLDAAITPWKSFRLDTTYDYFSYIENYEDINIITYVDDSSTTAMKNFTSIHNILYTYDMNTTYIRTSDVYEIRTDGIAGVDLFILIGYHNSLTNSEIETLRVFVASGGSLLVLGDATVSTQAKLNELLRNFGMEFYTSPLYSKDTAVNSSIVINPESIVNLPYIDQPTYFTNQTVASLDYYGTAINFTNGIGEGIYQFQEGDLYDTLNISGDFFIDSDKDGEFNSTNDLSLNDSAVVQAALELQRGGKLIACASADIVNASFIVERSNKYLLLHQIQWLLNVQNLISYDNFNVFEESVITGDAINVNITVHGDNDTVEDNVKVWVVVQELKTDKNISNLSDMGDGINFNGSIIPEGVKAKFVDISIRMHKRGFGYNETELIEVYIETILSGNIRIEYVSLIVFIISIGLVGLGVFALRKYRTD